MVATLVAAVVGWWWEAISRFTFACLVVFIRAFPPLHVFACLLVFVHAFLFKSFSCFNKKIPFRYPNTQSNYFKLLSGLITMFILAYNMMVVENL